MSVDRLQGGCQVSGALNPRCRQKHSIFGRLRGRGAPLECRSSGSGAPMQFPSTCRLLRAGRLGYPLRRVIVKVMIIIIIINNGRKRLRPILSRQRLGHWALVTYYGHADDNNDDDNAQLPSGPQAAAGAAGLGRPLSVRSLPPLRQGLSRQCSPRAAGAQAAAAEPSTAGGAPKKKRRRMRSMLLGCLYGQSSLGSRA